MHLKDLIGLDLGSRELTYTERDAILYAIAVGANSNPLDLVYERNLRVLPSYACALGLWAVEAAGELGAYDRTLSLHASQQLQMHAPMPISGPISSTGRIRNVWDKGRATVVDIEVCSEIFTANYAIFLPGIGDWGGERGPASVKADECELDWTSQFDTHSDQATLYRLTGDLHPIHIDVDVAKANGFDRPILHGLCTLGIAARECAAAVGVHPADLLSISAKLAAPVMPGDRLHINAGKIGDNELRFVASVGKTQVLKSGHARYTSVL